MLLGGKTRLSFRMETLNPTLQAGLVSRALLPPQADRDGRHLQFCDAYDNSSQKKTVLQEVDMLAITTKDNVSEETLKELAVQSATTNGFLFTLWTLFKVGTLSKTHPNHVTRT